jgi:hypothetical protein
MTAQRRAGERPTFLPSLQEGKRGRETEFNATFKCRCRVFLSQLASDTWPGMPGREAYPWSLVLVVSSQQSGRIRRDGHDQRHAPGPDVRLARFWPPQLFDSLSDVNCSLKASIVMYVHSHV